VVKSSWALTPAESIRLECGRRGTDALVDGCIRLMRGQSVDVPLVEALAGPASGVVLDYEPDDEKRYWLRVWGARGLLWARDDVAVSAIRDGLADPHWRVREMSAKVIARHAIGDLLEAVAELRHDPIPRVRAAATRAVAVLTARGA
jgi:hypothetical protein